MGLSGLGQAEMASIKRSDVDLKAGRIVIYRHKTSKGFVIPIYPQLRPLVERLCQGKAHDNALFARFAKRARLCRTLARRLDFRSSPTAVAADVHHPRIELALT